jgi:hypothetical protein
MQFFKHLILSQSKRNMQVKAICQFKISIKISVYLMQLINYQIESKDGGNTKYN